MNAIYECLKYLFKCSDFDCFLHGKHSDLTCGNGMVSLWIKPAEKVLIQTNVSLPASAMVFFY